MNIDDFIYEVATTYDRHAGVSTEAQVLLRGASTHLKEHVPSRLLIKGSGGMTNATSTPWVAVFDPEETTSARSGIYVVYLFAADLRSVTLALAQGITVLKDQVGSIEARRILRGRATSIRARLPDHLIHDLDDDIELGDSGWRQRAYEASTVAALRYELGVDRTERQFRTDLTRFIDLYRRAISVHSATSILNIKTSGAVGSVKGGGGESDRHIRLKLYVMRHPELFGLVSPSKAEIEHYFETTDHVDDYFLGGGPPATVVEVEREGEQALRIGVLQAIKYRALAAAELSEPHIGINSSVNAWVVAYEVDYPSVRRLADRYQIGLRQVDEALVLSDEQ